MARLRCLRHLHLLMLLCQLLVLGVATAAPWVNPQPYGPLCSAGGGGSGSGTGAGAGTLDCPACLPLLAPPPAQAPVQAPAHAQPLWWQLPAAAVPDLLPTPLPPVRGPPSV